MKIIATLLHLIFPCRETLYERWRRSLREQRMPQQRKRKRIKTYYWNGQ